MANLIGQILGQYKITGLVGEGGMATVYQARQESIKRSVAIKVIESKLARNPDFVRRFEREAQTVASLSHSHILKVFDYGQQEDLIYLVMELLTGGSLADLLSRGPLPPNVASQMFDQIASALDYAHRRGIIHRDLKPQNVLLDDNSDAHLTDFGIAKILSETTALTLSGVAMGTPAYMAPEQWSGDALDARADIYSLGVMLFEMMTGKVPFRADTPASMMHAHIYEVPPPVRTFRTDLPPGVDAVIQKALSKDREQRYGSAGEMASAFKLALAGQMPVAATPPKAGPATMIEAPMPRQTPVMLTAPLPLPTSKRRNASLLALIGIVIAVLLIGGVFFLLSRNTPPSTTPTIPAVALQPTATTSAIGEPQTSEVTSTPNLEQRAAGTITARAANAISTTQMFTPTLTETADEQETLNAMVAATLSVVAPVIPPSSTLSPVPPSSTVTATNTPVPPTTTATSTETASPIPPTETSAPTITPAPPTVASTATSIGTTASVLPTLSLQFQATPTYEPTIATGRIVGKGFGLLTIRTEPQVDAPSYAYVSANTPFDILARTADLTWLYIDYNGTTGWVVAASVYPANSSLSLEQIPQLTATPTLTPTAAQSSGLVGKGFGVLPIRTEPRPDAPSYTNIGGDTPFDILGRTADLAWLYIDYNGTTGWVAAASVYLADSSLSLEQIPQLTATPTLTPTAAQSSGLVGKGFGLLPIRTEPQADAPSYAYVSANTPFDILGRTADLTWLYIDYNGTTGWVAAASVYPANSLQSLEQIPPLTATPTMIPTAAQSSRIVGKGFGVLPIRTEPQADAPSYAYVSANTPFDILGRTADLSWLYIDYNGTTGWVAAASVYPADSSQSLEQIPQLTATPTTAAPTATAAQQSQGITGKTTEYLDVREDANGNAPTLLRIQPNTGLLILGRSTDNTWYFITIDGVQGWLVSAGVDLTDPTSIVRVPMMTAVPTTLTVPTATANPPSSQGITGKTTEYLDVREDANGNAPTLLRIQPNTGLLILGRSTDDTWYFITIDGVQGWLVSAGVDLTDPKSITQIPVIGATATSTPVARTTTSSGATLYDDFNNPAFDGSYNTNLWSGSGSSLYQVSQKNGVLLLTNSLSSSSKDSPGYDLSLRNKTGIPLAQVQSFDVRIKLDKDHQGNYAFAKLGVSADTNNFTWWTQCRFGVVVGNANPTLICDIFSSVGSANTVMEYQTPALTLQYGTWYMIGIAIDPSTVKISYYLDKRLLYSRIPKDAKLLTTTQFHMAIGAWDNDGSSSLTRYFDDVHINS